MTGGLGRLAVNGRGPIPTGNGFIINHRARDPHDEIVRYRAGKVLNYLCLARREPMADLRRGLCDVAYRLEHGGGL